ncbi:histone H2B-like [Musca domestica]|uniref:Histone H2B n=1 Tax=Musca domestica TaxID=7370 RepID=A0ABM3VK51_MUSDO|nr:histone H2B-like [Musca domestica]
MPPKTSGKAAKKAGKAQKNITKGDKSKRRTKRKESYAIYIYKVFEASPSRHRYLLQGHEHHEQFRQRYLRTYCRRSLSLAHYNKRSTITSREIQTAVRLLLPGELAKHAVSEGTKAVTKYPLQVNVLIFFIFMRRNTT